MQRDGKECRLYGGHFIKDHYQQLLIRKRVCRFVLTHSLSYCFPKMNPTYSRGPEGEMKLLQLTLGLSELPLLPKGNI